MFENIGNTITHLAGRVVVEGCYSCVRWDNSWSEFFMLSFGVRQGSVLSPLLFAVYINDLIMSFPNNCGVYAILYADDILLISPTVCMHASKHAHYLCK